MFKGLHSCIFYMVFCEHFSVSIIFLQLLWDISSITAKLREFHSEAIHKERRRRKLILLPKGFLECLKTF